MTGNEYADWVTAYLAHQYGHRGILLYREVSLGKSIIGKNRRIDILARLSGTERVMALECKYQAVPGTADEKIPYTIEDLKALQIPAYVVYAGEGFSQGVLHMLQGSPLAAYCLPDRGLASTKTTLELDHLIATTFGFWDAVIKNRAPFDLADWRVRHEKLDPLAVTPAVIPSIGSSGIDGDLSSSESVTFAIPNATPSIGQMSLDDTLRDDD